MGVKFCAGVDAPRPVRDIVFCQDGGQRGFTPFPVQPRVVKNAPENPIADR